MNKGKASVKNIKDYLHLYLGCQFIYGNGPKVWDGWTGFVKTDTYYFTDEERNHIKMGGHILQVVNIKLILRPLSDMTKEEKEKANSFADNLRDEQSAACCMAATTHYFLSKHFDLFGLIESGLAIDKTKLNSHDNYRKA